MARAIIDKNIFLITIRFLLLIAFLAMSSNEAETTMQYTVLRCPSTGMFCQSISSAHQPLPTPTHSNITHVAMLRPICCHVYVIDIGVPDANLKKCLGWHFELERHGNGLSESIEFQCLQWGVDIG